MAQDSDFVLVVGLHFDLRLLELVDLLPNHLHFLKLTSQLVFKFPSAPRLVVKFLAQLLQQLGQARVGSRNHSTMRVVHGDVARLTVFRKIGSVDASKAQPVSLQIQDPR
jgi:hypothetical protein